MNCADFERWLDAGCPDAESGPAAAHAERCASCAGALRAARAVDLALRAEARALPAPPADFVARVMSRVHEPARRRWLLELASDPVGAVSLTLALAIGVAALWRPDGTTSVASTLMARPLRSLASAAVSEPIAAVSRAFGSGLDPAARIGIEILAAAWVCWAAVIVYRRLERVIVLLGRRGGV